MEKSCATCKYEYGDKGVCPVVAEKKKYGSCSEMNYYYWEQKEETEEERIEKRNW